MYVERKQYSGSLAYKIEWTGIFIALSPLTPVSLGDESGNKVIPVSSLSNLCKF